MPSIILSGATTPSVSIDVNRSRYILPAVLILAAVNLFALLGFRGLNEPDEARMGTIARAMLESHEWMTPRVYDHLHVNKPPLLYWTMLPFLKLGGINEWMARLPSALSAFGILLMTGAAARRLLGADRALVTILVLLTMPLFFAMSQIIDYNMLLSLWTTLCLWSFVAWAQDGRPIHRLLFYVGLGLAFMTKGPVGPAIVILGLASYRWRVGALPWRRLLWWPGIATALALSLWWFIAICRTYPELWRYFLLGELFDRVFTDSHHRGEPFLFYVVILPLGILPWFVPFLLSVIRSRGRWRTDPATRLGWAWLALPLVMFTLSHSKMPTYILPLLPGIALCIASTFTWPVKKAFFIAVALLVLYQAGHLYVICNEGRLHAQTTVRQLCAVIQSHWQPGSRIAQLERHPRGLGFYLGLPVSVPLRKYEIQVEADRERVREKDFYDPIFVFRCFDSTQQVFIVCTERVYQERQRDAKAPVHLLYRDRDRLLISNR